MKPSRALAYVLSLALAGAAGWFAARHSPAAHETAAPAGRKVLFYQSPMHPWIKSDKPGKCTICGMALAPVYEGESGFAAAPGIVTLSTASASVVGVQTAEVRRGALVRSLRVTGVLDDDETLHRILAARVPGRVEKLFVNQVGAEVAAGQPLATLYSPDILTAQRLYLERLKAGSLAITASELADAREKLLALGLVEDDIARLEKTRVPESSVTVRAPMAGTVVARAVYEGQYVQPDSVLFEIGDLSHLWFLFDVYEADFPFVHLGQSVAIRVPSLLGETITAPVQFIDPNLNEMTRTARARVVVPNADRRLRHRQTASAFVTISTPDALLVPRSAVLQTRDNPLVFVDQGGHAYAPRSIKLGRVGDTHAEVLSGLREGDSVVTQGALLLDGQAQLAHSSEPAAAEPDHASHVDSAPLPSALVLAAADASAALAADDLPAYAKLIPSLTPSLPHSLSALARNLVAGPDLKAARAAFEPYSTAVADLVRAQPADKREKLLVFQCPMSPVLGKARWLQRDAALKNPFFGSEMLECGEELK